MSEPRTARAIVRARPLFDPHAVAPKVLALHESESRREVQRCAIREWKSQPLSQRVALVDRFVDQRLSEAGYDRLAEFEVPWVFFEATGKANF